VIQVESKNQSAHDSLNSPLNHEVSFVSFFVYLETRKQRNKTDKNFCWFL